jgi:Fur family ferric uptake transcriptional regulator
MGARDSRMSCSALATAGDGGYFKTPCLGSSLSRNILTCATVARSPLEQRWRACVDVREAADELHSRGFRVTRQRAAILAAIEEAGCALDPSEILELARRRCPELGLATVYRAMDVLDGIGAVRRVHTSKGCAGVAGAKATHGHSVVCTSCGRVSEFSACDVGALAEAAARETGFTISDHFIELAGICAECRQKRRVRRTKEEAPWPPD